MKITTITCEHIRCDEATYKAHPFCVDSRNPVFGFSLCGDEYSCYVDYYKILVSSSRELLDEKNGDMWDSGIVYDSDISLIRYDGAELESKKTYYFRLYVSVGGRKIRSRTGVFTTGIFNHSQWGCGFIGIAADKLTRLECPERDKVGLPAPYLRRAFFIKEGVISAKAYATAFGIYELYINGQRGGDRLLSPGWTNYTQSLQYQYYDLTDKLTVGENVVGAVLADGWYAGNVACVGREQYGTYPLGFMMNLTVEYEDGSVDTFVTDGSWVCSQGAILYSDEQSGEYYDARREPDGWCEAGYDAGAWSAAVGVNPPKCQGTRLKASIGPQIREMLTITPISISHDKDGKIIVDMGQNMVGHIRMKIKASAGDGIIFRYGEMLNEDGTLYTANLRSCLQTDTYVCAGREGEVFEPHFTFHGFRYAEIDGLSYTPSVEDITGVVIYSACEQTGYIETSSELVNKLFSNVLWGQRGNFVGVPTDCPQRDERMGWTGDAQVFCRSACYNMDCYGFYTKYLEDLLESQKPNGAITDVAPHVKWPSNGYDLVGHGNAAWGDALFVIPYTVYSMYGDCDILIKAYDAMVRYFDYLLGSTNNLIRPNYGYGDWLSIDDDTPLDVLSTAYFAYDAYIMYKISSILGFDDDRRYYAKMFSRIKKAWCDEFVDDEIRVKGDTQCCYLLALKMRLLPQQHRDTAAEHLVRTIERKNYHLSTGFVGVSYLLPMLCDSGYGDIAYRLLLNETYPSWGYSIKNGATTVWERWNSYTLENGFGDEGMNSFNHYSLGSCAEWMYTYMGGIRPKTAGYGSFYIKPCFSGRLDYVSCRYNSVNGEISSSWKKTHDGYELTVRVPINTTAFVMLKPRDTLLLTDAKVKRTPSHFECGSGTYVFEIKE